MYSKGHENVHSHLQLPAPSDQPPILGTDSNINTIFEILLRSPGDNVLAQWSTRECHKILCLRLFTILE
jgi:hypothetical protein